MAAIAHRLRCEVLEARQLMAADSGSLMLTVESSEVDGLRAAEIQLRYDPAVLDLTASDIQAGDAWRNQASLVANVDQSTGSINIFLFTLEPIAFEKGELVDMRFQVSDALAEDVSTISLSKMSLNEGAVESEVRLTRTAAPASDIDEGLVVRACAPWPKPIETPLEQTSHLGNERHRSEDMMIHPLATPPIEVERT